MQSSRPTETAAKTIGLIMEEKLLSFLRSRDIEKLERMEEEKIDVAAILLMTDDQLSVYIPRIGDRLATVAFCKSLPKTAEITEKPAPKKKIKLNLIEKLRHQWAEDRHGTKGSRRVKNERAIELGWMNFNGSDYKQVRATSGGGTRHVHLNRQATKHDIIAAGKTLFFPDGESTKGPLKDFTFSLKDFKGGDIDGDLTLQEMYDQSKMRMMRFYLATKDYQDTDDDDLPSFSAIGAKSESSTTPSAIAMVNNYVPFCDLANTSVTQGPFNKDAPSCLITVPGQLNSDTAGDPPSAAGTQSAVVTVPKLNSAVIEGVSHSVGSSSCLITIPNSIFTEGQFHLVTTLPQVSHHATASATSTVSTGECSESGRYSPLTVYQSTPEREAPAPAHAAVVSGFDFNVDTLPDLHATSEVAIGDDSGTIVFGSGATGEDVSLDATLPLQANFDSDAFEVVIRRSQCLHDMMEAFSDPSILSKRLSMRWKCDRGILEEASGEGVFRDCLTQFWDEFSSQCTTGQSSKVPYLRHDFAAEKWKSVARIYLIGWREYKYIPLALAAPFMEEVIYGKTFTSLTETFLKYVDEDEKEVLERALNGHMESDQMDDLITVLDAYDCRRHVTTDNVHRIIEEIAHKVVIQTPMFVIDCWRTPLEPMAFQSHEVFISLYDSLNPSTKVVKKLLVIPDEKKHGMSAKHLLKFVGGLDSRLLKRFLRFCTGSDLNLGYPIKVNFIELVGLQRRPMGHTCTRELDIPVEYDNYPQFRDEFSNILESNEWEMEFA